MRVLRVHAQYDRMHGIAIEIVIYTAYPGRKILEI